MIVKFLLVCEGSSDRGLVPHLEALCVRAGADGAMGDAPDLGLLRSPPGKAIEEQAQAALQFAGDVNLLFAHQDADARGPAEVRRRIRDRLATVEGCPPHVCVIPVRELEAWLLLDEAAIRDVAGNPRGRDVLELPHKHRVEATDDPKRRLKEALTLASGKTGARLQKFKQQFPELRATLLQRLDLDGPINDLPAWQRLVADVQTAVTALARVHGRTLSR